MQDKKSFIAVDMFGKELSGEKICEHLASILGWGNVPPYTVLEKDLVQKLNQLKSLLAKENAQNKEIDMNDKKYILVVWEMVPEDTYLYLIPEDVVTEEHRKLLKLAHGSFIGTETENEGSDFLNYAFAEKDNEVDFKEQESLRRDSGARSMSQYIGIFREYKQKVAASPESERVCACPITIENTHITSVYVSGFMM